MRLLRKLSRNARAAREIARGVLHTDHPFLVHLVPVRRCNIDCGYCNEYDKVSLPVPLARIERWLDKLAELGASVITCSGGEPLLHPQIASIVAGIRKRGMLSGLISNGYLLAPKKIHALNDAGLDYLQVSIDNLEPDEVSKKSLRLVNRKLEWLAEHATFDVNINSVLGAGTKNPDDVRVIAERAHALGFSMSLGLIHDGSGHLKPLGEAERRVWDDVNRMTSGRRQMLQNLYSALNGFQQNLADGKPNTWRCRAGARYLYVCEEGLVHLCSQQRGYPATPLERYSIEDVRREFASEKPCAPYCTVGCVHRVSTLDFWRRPQHSARGGSAPTPDVGRGGGKILPCHPST
jgi:MoaA/NifB/PqqE/SkfB family radical SAM enzyme